MSRPWNEAPLGTVRRGGKRDYLYVKVAPGGWPAAWRLQHYVNWEAAHGPVPDGHVLTFRDGDVEHTAVANLECVAKADWIKRYHVEATLPPAVARLVRIKSALTRAINQRQRGDAA